MRIMIIDGLDFSVFGGMERVFLTMNDYFGKTGHHVEFIGIPLDLQEDINEQVKGLNIARHKGHYHNYRHKAINTFVGGIFGIDYSADWKIISDVLDRSADDIPDVILACDNNLVLDCKKAIRYRGLNTKVVYWPHGTLFIKRCSLKGRIGGLLYDFNLKQALKSASADACLAISTGIKDQVSQINRSLPVYTVFDPLISYAGPLVNRSNSPVFIYVSRLEDCQKNVSFMFKGLSQVLDKNWKSRIVGIGPDETKLKELAKTLKISDRIEWVGFKKDPYEGMREATALLLTSRFEGFGMVLVEANQRGIPVISSNCQAGPSDIVISGRNGYLYQEGNMDDFVKTVRGVIDGKLTFGTPEEIAKTAERFSEDRVMKSIIDALNDICKRLS